MSVVSPDRSFWRGKRVLLTGHTGFKGAWLALWLRRLGAEVTGLALAADEPSLYRLVDLETSIASRIVDLRDAAAVATAVRAARPEIVFHLAAQALVRASYREPLATFATNTMGTAHLLDALRGAPGRARRRRRHDRQGLPQPRVGVSVSRKRCPSAATIRTARARPRPSWSRRATAARSSQRRASRSRPRAPATSSAAATGARTG